MARYKAPHCAHMYHLQLCVCGHTRYLHREEQSLCSERGCDCQGFILAPNYREIAHETIPVEGKQR